MSTPRPPRESQPAAPLPQADLADEQAVDLPNREAMSVLDMLPGTAGPVPLPTGGTPDLPQADLPATNPDGAYSPSTSSTASS